MKPRILIISPADVEFVQRMETLPYPGEDVVGGTFDYIPGGEGSEMAVAAAALGAFAIGVRATGASSAGANGDWCAPFACARDFADLYKIIFGGEVLS